MLKMCSKYNMNLKLKMLYTSINEKSSFSSFFSNFPRHCDNFNKLSHNILEGIKLALNTATRIMSTASRDPFPLMDGVRAGGSKYFVQSNKVGHSNYKG